MHGGHLPHTPNPVLQLLALRRITRELLYLGTHTIPEIPGVENGCVYYPYLSEASTRAYAAPHRDSRNFWGIGVPFNDKPMFGYANFWWGISPSALRAMLATARFEVVEETHNDRFSIDVVARPVDKDPILPPLAYFRERGEQRARGEEPEPFEGYYERRRSS